MKVEFEDSDKLRGKFIGVFLVGMIVGIMLANQGFFGEDFGEQGEFDGGFQETPEACQDVPEMEVDMCIANEAINTGDYDLCSSADDLNVVRYCQGAIYEDSDYCEDIGDEFLKANCLRMAGAELTEEQEQIIEEEISEDLEN